MRVRDKSFFGASALLALALVPAFASCAESHVDQPSAPDDSLSLDGGGADAGNRDAGPDAGCDPSDDDCVARPLSCDEAPWCPVPTTVSGFYALTAVWGASKNDVWAVGSGGTIVHWDGTAWTATPTAVKNTFNTVWGSGPNDVWVASSTDAVFRSAGWAGKDTEWERVPLPLDKDNDAPVFAIWGTKAGDLVIAGQSFYLPVPDTEDFVASNAFVRHLLPDGSFDWVGIPGTANVYGIWGSGPEDVWLVADNSLHKKWELGLTLHGSGGADGGALTWTEVDSRSAVALRAIWGSSANDIWAVGDMGSIRHATSATVTKLEVVPSPTSERLRAVWGSAADDVWAVGDVGTILHYDGKAWTKTAAAFPVGKKPTLYGVWGSARDDVWIVGDGVALHYTGAKLGDAGGSQ